MRLWLVLLACLFAVANADRNESQSLLWGTWRPGIYFGLRPRLPKSLMTGLIWFGTQDFHSFKQPRHQCDQGDGLDTYTWTAHDPREGGIQVLKDSRNNVEITIEWLKVAGGDHGGSWAARIKGVPVVAGLPMRTSFIPYFGLEGLGNLELENEEDENGLESTVRFSGSTPDLGNFKIRIVEHQDNKPITEGIHEEHFTDILGRTNFVGLRHDDIWQAKDVIMPTIYDAAQATVLEFHKNEQSLPDPAFILRLPNDVYSGSNLFAIQKFFEGNFQFDIFYESDSAKQKLDSSILDNGIPAFVEAYQRRFQSVFPLQPSSTPSQMKFSQDITANLMGGIGYFYGNSIIDRAFAYEWDEEDEVEGPGSQTGNPRFTEPKELLTATPSRSFFPRGFYWDEGFHLLHIGAWDTGLSLEILRDWINLIDEDGWVAREQILGEEARSRVPAEFVTQHPTYANPPTLTMAITAIISRMRSSSSQGGPTSIDLGMQGAQAPFFASDTVSGGSAHQPSDVDALAYLKSIYSPLKRHYNWFRRTQRGQIKQYARVARSRTEAYRWRGRSPDHVLTSGMDDYPRGPPHAGELHLDLISWMAFFTRTMKDIANYVGEQDDEKQFAQIEVTILENIEDLHWNEDEKMYCDANIDNNEESYHVCHKGYLSLFPFLLGLLPPDSPHLGPILDLLSSPDHLWSPYGIRSLSVSHPLFGKDENYWRGPIWIQVNYLALQSLYTIYAVKPGPQHDRARTIYSDLRENIIKNVHKEYERTGYVWEQYDPLTGEGRRSHPFTGWTSLVALILSERY